MVDMEYITEQITYPPYASKAFNFYFGGRNIGVLDIETTGLSPRRDQFVLGGLLTVRGSVLTLRQFFAEDPGQEQKALREFLEAISGVDFLLTYNGQRFDIPFIRERAHGGGENLPYNLDLYLLIKGFSPIRRFLPNLKQKTVENFMGLWAQRTDEISGKESVDLYHAYAARKEPSLKEKILLHNRDDVLQLHRLLAVLGKADLHKAMFCMGFPVFPDTPELPELIVEKISLTGQQLKISGRQAKNALDYRCYEWEGIPCSVRFNGQERLFWVSAPIIKQSGMTVLDLRAMDLVLPDLRSYPDCQDDFLILEKNGEPLYLEINHITKLFLERILNQWIIKP